MKNIAYLTARYLRANPWPAGLIALALALVAFLPAATSWTTARLRADLTARAEQTPLIGGALGSRLDLVLEALTFRGGEIPGCRAAFLDELREDPRVLSVPVLRAGTVREFPLVCTSPEYFEQRELYAVRGGLPLILGECVLGFAVAQELGLGPGDVVFSDPTRSFDVSRPQTLQMPVVGVLAETGTPDDRAVFADLRTGWVIEGLYHGHEEVDPETDPELVMAESESSRILSQAVLSFESIRPENLASFHLHAAREELPISFVLLFPVDTKAATLIETRVDLAGTHQVVSARKEIDLLLSRVLDLERFIRILSGVLGAGTLALAAVVVALSSRLRETEWRALDRLGAPRSSRMALHGAFLLAALLVAAGLFALLIGAWIRFHPDPTRWL